MGRFSNRLYVAYSTFYVIGTLASMQIPFVGFQPTFTSEHMAALGTFGLIQLVAFANFARTLVPENHFRILLRGAVVSLFVVGLSGLVLLTMSGVIAPWTGRFYSLWDTGYAKIHIPIIASVSEHQPTAWPNFFFDLNMLIWLLPAGIYFSFSELTDNHVFLILYSIFAAYFASVMVRLILTLTPIVCVLAGVAMAHVFETYLNFRDVPAAQVKAKATPDAVKGPADAASDDTTVEDTDSASGHKKEGKRGKTAKKNAAKAAESTTDTSANGTATQPSEPVSKELSPALKRFYALFPKFVVMTCFMFLLCMFQWHCSWITSTAYSSPS
ncbi:oligosaccharyl transferase stt3 subunit, partial [Coemansia sp. RSA 2337]